MCSKEEKAGSSSRSFLGVLHRTRLSVGFWGGTVPASTQQGPHCSPGPKCFPEPGHCPCMCAAGLLSLLGLVLWQ